MYNLIYFPLLLNQENRFPSKVFVIELNTQNLFLDCLGFVGIFFSIERFNLVFDLVVIDTYPVICQTFDLYWAKLAAKKRIEKSNQSIILMMMLIRVCLLSHTGAYQFVHWLTNSCLVNKVNWTDLTNIRDTDIDVFN